MPKSGFGIALHALPSASEQTYTEYVNSIDQTFEWRPFLLTQLPCGLFTTLCALLLDNTLRQYGVGIHPWREAVISGAAGIFFSSLFVPILWRLGLVTVPQYLLGAVGLFVPATLLSLLVVHFFQPILIDIAGFEFAAGDSRAWAMAVYIRISRSVVLFPTYVFAFWFIYHKCLGRQHL